MASTRPISVGTEGIGAPRFAPSFPGGCPFITSVGATQIANGSTVNDPETACETVIFSGGGFSNIFPLPNFQAAAVKGFLKNHPPPYTAQQFNNSGKVGVQCLVPKIMSNRSSRSARSLIFRRMGKLLSLHDYELLSYSNH
jgi:hypothetical protein